MRVASRLVGPLERGDRRLQREHSAGAVGQAGGSEGRLDASEGVELSDQVLALGHLLGVRQAGQLE